jgi:hypothetical protein
MESNKLFTAVERGNMFDSKEELLNSLNKQD